MKVAKLILVDGTTDEKGNQKNNNKYYNMFENSDGTFTAKYGRVDVTEQTKNYPSHKWGSVYRAKIKKGYKDVTHLFLEADTSNDGDDAYLEIQDSKVKMFVDALMNYAHVSVEKNYKVSAKNVTQAQLDEAQSIIDNLVFELKLGTTSKLLNNLFLDLYQVIPRKMKKVQDHLISDDIVTLDKSNIASIREMVGEEQDTLDVMLGQVQTLNVSSDDKIKKDKTLLQSMGLDIVSLTKEEEVNVKKMLKENESRYHKAFKVQNKKTEKVFSEYKEFLKTKGSPTKPTLLWHGSRNENWWNIINSGLLIRPSNAIHTGSMFGDGIYFANKSQKSLGYTSARGAYWTGGGSNSGILSLYKILLGKHLDIKRHSPEHYSLSANVLDKIGGYDSVYAHGGADLRNDEFIIYKKEQCTINFIVEVK